MVATFRLHYLGHRIKYGNRKVGNTTQQLLSTTRPSYSIEFIESFLFWVILVTYNIGIYICLYIYIYIYICKVSYTHSVFVVFNCNVFCALHAKHFEIWKKYFVKLTSRLLYSTIRQMMWYFWVFIVNPFYLLCSFFSQENFHSLVCVLSPLSIYNKSKFFIFATFYLIYGLDILLCFHNQKC